MYPWLSRLQIKYSHLNNPAYWQKAHTLADKKRMNLDGNGSSVDCVGVCTSYSEMSDLPIVITYFSECKSRGVQNENGVGSLQRGWKSKWIQFRFSFKSSRSNGKTTMAKSKENWITGTYQEKVSLLSSQFRGQTSTLSGVEQLLYNLFAENQTPDNFWFPGHISATFADVSGEPWWKLNWYIL